MALEDELNEDEKVLWHGAEKPAFYIRKGLKSWMRPVALAWLLIYFMCMHHQITGSGSRCAVILKVILALLPVWIYLGWALAKIIYSARLRYCLTTEGLYVLLGKRLVSFIRCADLGTPEMEASARDGGKAAGSVTFWNTRPTRKYRGSFLYVLRGCAIENIADYENVYRLIYNQRQELAEQRRKEMLEQPAESSEESVLQNEETDAAVLESLPDETVGELQAELFGAHAEQQGAFPDPTVYPLPELPQEQQGEFLQQ